MIELKTDSWLEKLPDRWQSRRLKHVASCNDEVLGEDTPKSLEIEYVDIGSVSGNGLVNNTERLEFASAPSRARRVVRDGDIIVSTVRTYLKAIAPIVDPPDNLIASTGFAVIRCNVGVVPRYMAYCLRTEGFVGEVISRSVGISYPAINATDLINIEVPVPSSDQQKQIASFLDYETAKIDALIEKQQQLIALLGEKRQAVISHAVTKGLNPDAPMRDSGVDWLGEVPSHWTVTRLKYIASIKGRIGFRGYTTADQVGEGEGALVLGASEIAPDGALRFHSPSYLSWEKYWESPEIMVRRNDIVVVQRGATTGKVGLVDEELGHTTINPSLILVRTPAEVGGYVFRFLTCDAARSAFEVETSQTTIPMMSQEELGNTFVLLPPEKERFDIAAYLDSSLSRIDELTARQHSLAELLRERRTALISAAVTGKIDVRGWKRPSADSTLETEMEVTGS